MLGYNIFGLFVLLIVYFSHYVKAVDWNPINIFRHMRWSFIVDGSIAVSVFCAIWFFLL